MSDERINIGAYTLMFTAERGIFEEVFLRRHSLSVIAELKRCYALLDAVEETYESIGICLYCDACETEHESHCKFASE